MENGNPKTYNDDVSQESWVEQVIRTDNGSLLFPEGYGTIAKDLIGKRGVQHFYKSELERTLKESAKMNSNIQSIDNIQITPNGEIKFSLRLNEG